MIPVLMMTSSTFKYYVRIYSYIAFLMVLATVIIPWCLIKSGGRSVNNMRYVRAVMRHVKYVYGLKMEVEGQENFQLEGPYVVISNHQSSLDMMGLMEVLPDSCVQIAKKELMYAGPVGMLLYLVGVIFINRKQTSDAKHVLDEAVQTIQKDKVRVWVFPEGTRNHGGDMLPFKKGAFHLAVQAQVPIIPVVYSSYYSFYSKKERRFSTGTIKIRILPKIETQGLSTDDIPELLEKSYSVMKDSFWEISDNVKNADIHIAASCSK